MSMGEFETNPIPSAFSSFVLCFSSISRSWKLHRLMHCGKIVFVHHNHFVCVSHFSTYCLGRFYLKIIFFSLGILFTAQVRKDKIDLLLIDFR